MFEQTFKNIDDVLWKEAGCSSELDEAKLPGLLKLKYYAIADAVAELGKTATIRAMFIGFQKQLCRSVAA